MNDHEADGRLARGQPINQLRQPLPASAARGGAVGNAASRNSDQVAAHGKAAVEQDRQGIAADGCAGRPRPLRVDLQMGLTGVARVPHGAEPDTPGNGVPRANQQAARAQVADEHVGFRAAQQDVVARHVLAVHLRNLHVGQAIHREYDPPGTRCQHAGAVDAIGT